MGMYEWFGFASTALAVIGAVATGPVRITAATWGVLGGVTGQLIDVGDTIAGC